MEHASSIGDDAPVAFHGRRLNALTGRAELLILCARIGFNPPA